MHSCPFSLLSTESSKTCRTLAKGANVIHHGDYVPKSQGQRDVPVQVFKRIQRPCLINCRCDGAFEHHSPVADPEWPRVSKQKPPGGKTLLLVKTQTRMTVRTCPKSSSFMKPWAKQV